LQRRETRLAKIRELKAQLEQEAQQAAAQEQEQKAADEPKNYRRRRWTKSESGAVVPKDKTQRNLTDPDSRLMMDTTTGIMNKLTTRNSRLTRRRKSSWPRGSYKPPTIRSSWCLPCWS
jgi:hypothetical protein